METNGLSLYETMSDISAQMARAAQDNDWERLVALEQDVAHLRETLVRTPAGSAVPLTPEQRARKLQLIHCILDHDAEVRRHTEPWMESVRRYLGAGVRSRSVRQAYGL
jgi:flagellar protein FliT